MTIEAPARPRVLIIGISILAFSFCLAYVRIFSQPYRSVSSEITFIVFITAFFAAICISLFKGVNWLRWVWVALTAFGLTIMPFTVPRLSSLELSIYIGQAVLQGVSGICLVMPSSNAWFKAQREHAAERQRLRIKELQAKYGSGSTEN